MKASSPFRQLCPSPFRFLIVNFPVHCIPPTKNRTWEKVLDLSETLLWLHLLWLPSTAGPDCPASQRNTVHRGNSAPQWTMVETPGAPLSVYLGSPGMLIALGAHLVQESHLLKKPKAPETWSWKWAAAENLEKQTMFKVFTGTAVGPQDTEQHRWNTLREVFLHNIPFQGMRRLKWMAESTDTEPGL